MVEHMMPAIGLIVFGSVLIYALSSPIALIGGFLLIAYGFFYISHHGLIMKHHK